MLWNGNPRTKSVNYKEINYTRTAVSRTLKKRIGSEYLLTETEKYDVCRGRPIYLLKANRYRYRYRYIGIGILDIGIGIIGIGIGIGYEK